MALFRRGVVLTVLLALAVATVSTLSLSANQAVVARINASFRTPRSFAEQALHTGLLSPMPNDAVLLVEGAYDLSLVQPGWNFYRWDVPAFYRLHAARSVASVVSTGKQFRGERLWGVGAEPDEPALLVASRSPQGTWFFGYTPSVERSGAAVFGRVTLEPGDVTQHPCATSAETWSVYSCPPAPPPAAIVFWSRSPDSPQGWELRRVPMATLTVTAQGDGWEVRAVPQPGAELRSARVELTPSAQAHSRRVENGVRFELHAPPTARRVFVAGSFNQWRVDDPAAELLPGQDGLLARTVTVPADALQYRFVIDGVWTSDPTNLRLEPNGLGEANNVIDSAP